MKPEKSRRIARGADIGWMWVWRGEGERVGWMDDLCMSMAVS